MRRAPILLIVLLAPLLAACGGQPHAVTAPTDSAAVPATDQPFEQRYRALSFDQIAAEARGQTVTWFMWGSSDAINSYVMTRLDRYVFGAGHNGNE